MANTPESKTPHFGLRDFLFYLVPGTLVLTACLLIVPLDDKTWCTVGKVGGFASSLAAILAAYILGQASYSACYPLRHCLEKWVNFPEKKGEFKKQYMWLVETRTTYYNAEVFRYRIFARFCLAMVMPCFILTWVFACYLFKEDLLFCAISVLVFGLLATYGFCWRYKHYLSDYAAMVEQCWRFKWNQHEKDGGPAEPI